MQNSFPPNFLWGAATSAHQTEGNNHNDWTEWEQQNKHRLAAQAEKNFSGQVPEWNAIASQATDPENYVSGTAADHYRRYPEDIQIMKSLGLNVYRFSVEWSRVQPGPQEWDEREIRHYADVIAELKANGIQPMVTLWHRTNPLWISKIGDWASRKTPEYFARYAEKIVDAFGGGVPYWTPLNEPALCSIAAFLGGQYPPQRKNIFAAVSAMRHFARAHKQTYAIIKRKNPAARVGASVSASLLEPYADRWYNKAIAKAGNYAANYLFLNLVRGHTDFAGVQYYSRGLINGFRQIKTIPDRSDMGWELYPGGLLKFCRAVHQRFGMPIIITENGIADARDDRRQRFIAEHLRQVLLAIEEGIRIEGYLYWSLLDNLEWDKGFWPKFGLVSVDRQTFSRTVRPSALAYATIVKANALP